MPEVKTGACQELLFPRWDRLLLTHVHLFVEILSSGMIHGHLTSSESISIGADACFDSNSFSDIGILSFFTNESMFDVFSSVLLTIYG